MISAAEDVRLREADRADGPTDRGDGLGLFGSAQHQGPRAPEEAQKDQIVEGNGHGERSDHRATRDRRDGVSRAEPAVDQVRLPADFRDRPPPAWR